MTSDAATRSFCALIVTWLIFRRHTLKGIALKLEFITVLSDIKLYTVIKYVI
jgi:hypothetical protein